jgi:hypothetical protein
MGLTCSLVGPMGVRYCSIPPLITSHLQGLCHLSCLYGVGLEVTFMGLGVMNSTGCFIVRLRLTLLHSCIAGTHCVVTALA